MKLLLVSDMDGVISKKQKTWYLTDGEFVGGDKHLAKAKSICDHDQHIARMLGQRMVFISGDPEINKDIAERWKVPFVHANTFKGDKYDSLCMYWKDVLKRDGLPDGKYAYVGDSMPDLKCLQNASIGFVPADASIILDKALIDTNTHVRRLKSNSGEGVLEEFFLEATRSDSEWTRQEIQTFLQYR